MIKLNGTPVEINKFPNGILRMKEKPSGDKAFVF